MVFQRRVWRYNSLLLYLIIMQFISMPLLATQSHTERILTPTINRTIHYSFTEPQIELSIPRSDHQTTVSHQSVSPGTKIGITYYDQQHNNSIGRMIDWGTHGTPDTTRIHFSWMYMNMPIIFGRTYLYQYYDFASESFSSPIKVQTYDEFGGYVGLNAYGNNRVVIGGHNVNIIEETAPQFYWSPAPGIDFSSRYTDRVPNNLMVEAAGVGAMTIWPKFRYVEGVNDTVLHVIAQDSEPNVGDPQVLVYFRRVGGPNSSATWDPVPFLVDTIYTLSHDLDANNAGKVALSWTANLPCSALDDDTASGYECKTYVHEDNDLYYQVSLDFGVTWEPRVNVTNHRLTEGIADSWRPYADLSVLLDQDDGELHIAWASRFWPVDANSSGQTGLIRSCLFHWSENVPYIRTIHNSDWDQTTCDGGALQLNSSKMSISQCNGKHYLLFVQFNDLPAGVTDDCATPTSPGYPSGAANGELYLSISSDGGTTWDVARNLTNSRTPGCDTLGGMGGPCESDHWPSVTKYGTNAAFNTADPNIDIVVPSGSIQNDWFLDVQYINDHSAGSIIKGEGFWQQADVRWFRLACVDPIPNIDTVISSIDSIGYPAWSAHGLQLDTPLTLTNRGNQILSYSMSIEEVTGPAGWLGVTGVTGSIAAGINNMEQLIVNLNNAGVVNAPGTIVNLSGRLIITSNADSSPDTIPISFYVTDELIAPAYDTIATSCLSLVVENDGSAGNEGIGKVNMDWISTGPDCDPDADIYLYSSSPVIGWVTGNDTIMNWSVFNAWSGSSVGFVPMTSGSFTQTASYQSYSSLFTTHDSSIALKQTWYAPLHADSCQFMIKELEIYSYDGGTHSGIVIGEVIDWDIPADSSNRNGSGYDAGRQLIYQYGAEYHQDDTGASPACQDNDLRYGAVQFLQKVRRTSIVEDAGSFQRAYTENNATYVYGTTYGLRPGELYENMTTSTGFSTWSTTYPDSSFTDLHTGMSFITDYTVQPGETLVVYTAYSTTMDGGLSEIQVTTDKALAWFCDNFPLCNLNCCVNRGNTNGLMGPGGPVDVSDLTYLVAFLFQGGPEPGCEAEGDVNNVMGPSGAIDVSDLTYLVAFLFQGGPPPPPC